jgi:hypothetical protein
MHFDFTLRVSATVQQQKRDEPIWFRNNRSLEFFKQGVTDAPAHPEKRLHRISDLYGV